MTTHDSRTTPADRAIVEAGEIVQINPRVEGWGGCLLVVSEPKSWGVQGYVQIPLGGQAYMRVKTEDFERIGVKAPWVIAEAGNE